MEYLEKIKEIASKADFSDEVKKAILNAKSTEEVISIIKPSKELIKLMENLYAKNNRTS